MNPHQRSLQAKVKYRNEPKTGNAKSEDLSRSLETNAIWTFNTEFPTIFIYTENISYITRSCATPGIGDNMADTDQSERLTPKIR